MGGASDPLDSFVDGMAEDFLSSVFVGQLEILVAARTDPKIGTVMRKRLAQYRTSVERTWISAPRRSGFAEAEAYWIFQLTLNVLRGLGLHRTWKPEPRQIKKTIMAWKEVLRRLSSTNAFSELANVV